MHPTSLENMARCRDRYAGPGWLEALPAPQVLDLGAADVNGSYRALFRHPRLRYTGADLAPGPGVDVVLDDPYRLPFDDASMDLVLSGQMLEHCEFIWRAFDEMVRVPMPSTPWLATPACTWWTSGTTSAAPGRTWWACSRANRSWPCAGR